MLLFILLIVPRKGELMRFAVGRITMAFGYFISLIIAIFVIEWACEGFYGMPVTILIQLLKLFFDFISKLVWPIMVVFIVSSGW